MADRVEFCNCGDYRRNKAGTTLADGVERCNACQLPVWGWGGAVAATPVVAANMISTLPDVPGYRVTSMRGIVTELASASGFTAGSKGAVALAGAMAALGRSAAALGANAVVGFQASSFGAAGGITSAFSGDAVGVLLVGTAVVVEPISADQPDR